MQIAQQKKEAQLFLWAYLAHIQPREEFQQDKNVQAGTGSPLPWCYWALEHHCIRGVTKASKCLHGIG